MDTELRYVTIARFNSAFNAQLARGALDAAGIHCELANEFSQMLVGPVDFFGGHGGHILDVPEQDAERAIELPRDTPAAESLVR